MGQYLLSTYRVEGEVPGSPQGPEEMQSFMGRVIALEEEMQSSGSFVFGGALRESDATNHPIEVRPFAATGLLKDMAV